MDKSCCKITSICIYINLYKSACVSKVFLVILSRKSPSPNLYLSLQSKSVGSFVSFIIHKVFKKISNKSDTSLANTTYYLLNICPYKSYWPTESTSYFYFEPFKSWLKVIQIWCLQQHVIFTIYFCFSDDNLSTLHPLCASCSRHPRCSKITGKQPRNPYVQGTHPYNMPRVNRRPTSRKALRLSLCACVFVCVCVWECVFSFGVSICFHCLGSKCSS